MSKENISPKKFEKLFPKNKSEKIQKLNFRKKHFRKKNYSEINFLGILEDFFVFLGGSHVLSAYRSQGPRGPKTFMPGMGKVSKKGKVWSYLMQRCVGHTA